MSDTHEHTWDDAQAEEREWWGNCTNTLGEEIKQLVYARYMGIHFHHIDGIPYQIDLRGDSVLDVGGGPVSLLLKTFNGGRLSVFDPCDYPQWVEDRYLANNINLYRCKGEDLSSRERYDQVWLYNCLQHVDDPELIIKNCLDALVPGGVFRIFEWIDTDVNEAHPHSLRSEDFHSWTGQHGGIVHLNESGCVGTAYYDCVTK